ncbi:MAG: hypothetical protein MK095_01400 [Phycisphaerales bacterium]|nr:hypothetical protein [Phycisphaerales bacterium]
MSSRPVVILAEPIEAASKEWLAARVELIEAGPEEHAFNHWLPEAAGIVVRTATQVDAAMLDAAPGLRVIARAGVGLDNIDQEACEARGIAVVHTPDANTQAVAEYVMTLVMDALRPRDVLVDAPSTDDWHALRSVERAHRQMDECRFGILGFGRIGQRVARMASAVGFQMFYTDLLSIDESNRSGATPLPLEELLSTSDVLSIHVDGRRSNHGLLDARHIAMLPPTSLLVNTSRGCVVEAGPLRERLRTMPMFRAILDVHDVEPIPEDESMLGMPNVTLLPHNAARTTTALSNMSRVVEDLARHLGVE